MVEHGARNGDAAGRRQRLHAGGDIHTVAGDAAVQRHQLADIDADPEMHTLLVRLACVPCIELALNRNGAIDGVYRAGKLRQQVVTHRVHHPATVLAHPARDHRPVHPQALERCEVVLGDEPCIAHHVCAEYRCQPAFGLPRGLPLGLSVHCFLPVHEHPETMVLLRRSIVN